MSLFDHLLGKLSELVGGDEAPTNAMSGARKVAEAVEPKVTYRASMLPVGNFDDGSVGMVWPQSAVDAKNAFGRFSRGESPQPQDAVLAGLAMTGAGAFGLGSRAVRGSVAGAERAEASGGLPSHIGEAGSFDFSPLHNGTRSAQVGNSRVVYNPSAGDSVDLSSLSTPPYARGQGSARGAMRAFTEALDAEGKPSTLLPEGDIGSDPARLRSFYKSFGYEMGDDGVMHRAPSKPGETLFSNAPDAAPVGALAMDAASRMERAKAMGYTTDAYHGSGNPNITAFDPGASNWDGGATWFADKPSVANRFARSYVETQVPYGPRPGLTGIWDRITGRDNGSFRSFDRTKEDAAVYPVKLNTDGFAEVDWPTFFREHAGRSMSNGDDAILEQSALIRQYQEQGVPGIVLKRAHEDFDPNHTQYAVFDPSRIRSVNAAFDPAKSDSANLLAANHPDAAPVGLLATTGLEKMQADDLLPRPRADIPSVAALDEQAFRTEYPTTGNVLLEDPQRAFKYANALGDMLDPRSEFSRNPTLHANPSKASPVGLLPMDGEGGEHHSRKQLRGDGGRFVSGDSFDGKLAAFQKVLVDLDGDGKPDALAPVPSNAMAAMRRR